MKKNTSFFERILQIADFYNIKNINIFAREYLGYASSEKINRLKKDNTNPSYDIIVDIANKFEKINPEWLLTGKGEMLRSDRREFPKNQSIAGNNNVQAGDNTKVEAKKYYSGSQDVLKAQVDLLEERIKEKDAQIKEKDAQINKLLSILSNK